jgi:serine/threonine protein kinase
MKGGSINLILNEINIHRRLIHKNVVRLYGYFEDNDNFYLVFETLIR